MSVLIFVRRSRMIISQICSFSKSSTTSISSSNEKISGHVEQYSNDELTQHAKSAGEWWDRCGPMRGLHSLNELRVPFIRDGLIANNLETKMSIGSKLLDGFEILEVGCGGGILTESLAQLHANVVGIDLGNEVISVAKEHSMSLKSNVRERLQYKVESIADHARKNVNKYDAVILSEVIEHIDNKIEFITNCIDSLKCGGSIFITTPNKTILSLICVIFIAENIANIVPKGTHTYEKFITPLDMQRILDSFNCNTVFINGMFYDILSNRWKFTNNTDFCYALQAIKT